ncbi:MAG UNVERIFIED_CONTAM: hypothetical protein LVT10_19860 [Anaerolineae bacterium]
MLDLRTTDFHAQDSVTGLSGADLANFQFFSDQAGQINVDDETPVLCAALQLADSNRDDCSGKSALPVWVARYVGEATNVARANRAMGGVHSSPCSSIHT